MEPSPTEGPVEPLRVGILGAARISDLSIVAPAKATGTRLVAIAARDPLRAKEFAVAHGVERVHATYDDLLADPEVEAVYNPLANGLHGIWNLRAIAGGRHVLSEKPSAANADEARIVRDAAAAQGVVLMEALHYPYHPRWYRLRELIASGRIGAVQRVVAPMAMHDPGPDDVRWKWELAGGSTMDLGCYSLSAMHLLGDLLGGPPRIVSARADERAGHPGVDERLAVEVEFLSGATGLAASDMASDVWDFGLTITGSDGEIHLDEFLRPHLDDRIVITTADGGQQVEELGRRSSYTYQLEAFARAVRDNAALVTGGDFAVTMAETIDAAYAAAGLPRREPTPTLTTTKERHR
jgi:predicted dehydrogenase